MDFNYEQMHKEELPFANSLADFLATYIMPSMVIDVGCGSGTYLHAFKEKGIKCIGYDNSEQLKNNNNIVNDTLFNIKETAPLIVCLEVAEHLEPIYSSYIVEKLISITNTGGSIIWSAAQVGQGGVGHINCQPKEFWESKFLQHKHIYRNIFAESVLSNFLSSRPRMGWFMNNFMIFSKEV